jgi:hypothetical protein
MRFLDRATREGARPANGRGVSGAPSSSTARATLGMRTAHRAAAPVAGIRAKRSGSP